MNFCSLLILSNQNGNKHELVFISFSSRSRKILARYPKKVSLDSPKGTQSKISLVFDQASIVTSMVILYSFLLPLSAGSRWNVHHDAIFCSKNYVRLQIFVWYNVLWSDAQIKPVKQMLENSEPFSFLFNLLHQTHKQQIRLQLGTSPPPPLKLIILLWVQ